MKLRVILILGAVLLTRQSVFAQRHEVAFTSGGLRIGERGFDLPQPGFLEFGAGFTSEIKLIFRLWTFER